MTRSIACSLPQPRRIATAAALAGACLLVLCACSDSGVHAAATAASAPAAGYAALARGKVDLQGGLLRVSAPRDGVLAQVPVEVGMNVKAGQVIAVLDAREAKLALGRAEAEVEQIRVQAAAIRGRLQAARQRASRLDEAAREGAASGQASDDAQAAAAQLQSELAINEASLLTARRAAAQARYAVEASTVHAPADGRVIDSFLQAGESVRAHTPLFRIMPVRPLIVRAELNEALVDRVKVGMRAEVVPVTDEAQAHAAKVLRIGNVFGITRMTDDTQEATDARSVECVLQLDDVQLRIGQRVLVRFLP